MSFIAISDKRATMVPVYILLSVPALASFVPVVCMSEPAFSKLLLQITVASRSACNHSIEDGGLSNATAPTTCNIVSLDNSSV